MLSFEHSTSCDSTSNFNSWILVYDILLSIPQHCYYDKLSISLVMYRCVVYNGESVALHFLDNRSALCLLLCNIDALESEER